MHVTADVHADCPPEAGLAPVAQLDAQLGQQLGLAHHENREVDGQQAANLASLASLAGLANLANLATVQAAHLAYLATLPTVEPGRVQAASFGVGVATVAVEVEPGRVVHARLGAKFPSEQRRAARRVAAVGKVPPQVGRQPWLRVLKPRAHRRGRHPRGDGPSPVLVHGPHEQRRLRLVDGSTRGGGRALDGYGAVGGGRSEYRGHVLPAERWVQMVGGKRVVARVPQPHVPVRRPVRRRPALPDLALGTERVDTHDAQRLSEQRLVAAAVGQRGVWSQPRRDQHRQLHRAAGARARGARGARGGALRRATHGEAPRCAAAHGARAERERLRLRRAVHARGRAARHAVGGAAAGARGR
eukprot:scaffold46340_cov63-Phaeocystis_antarctica.AAC.2